MSWKTKKSRRDYVNARRASVIKFLREIRLKSVCKSCGWDKHPEILHFHHRDPKDKKFNLSAGNVGMYSINTIQKEVDKCDMLCPNCHVYLHYLETRKIID